MGMRIALFVGFCMLSAGFAVSPLSNATVSTHSKGLQKVLPGAIEDPDSPGEYIVRADNVVKTTEFPVRTSAKGDRLDK